MSKNLVKRCLQEDLRTRGDITTRATISTEQAGEAIIKAKAEGVIAGQNIARWVFESLDKKCQYGIEVEDGKEVKAGDVIARISGKTWVILVGERSALNIMGRSSGIATLTAQYVRAVDGTKAKISETRKTAPGLRYLDKEAVRVGGGVNHRKGLHDAFLIKENHIAAAGGISAAIVACREYREKWYRYRIIVEVRNMEEYREALEAKPERILLDNMTTEELRTCVEVAHESVELEASGGVTLETVRGIAETGVDFISVGALTHSAGVLDLSLLIVA
ncbi:carboxylating nicotinate-nucleotide diphosphorylase [Calditrichota bacterium]